MKYSRALLIALGLSCSVNSFSQTTAPALKSSAPVFSATNAASASAAKSSNIMSDKTGPSATAPGGGNGKVWVNNKTKVYHCEGSKFYGQTKTGEYMTEANAKSAGNHADHGTTCTK